MPETSWLLPALIAAVTSAAHADKISDVHAALQNPGRHHLNLVVGAPDQQTIMPMTVIVGDRPARPARAQGRNACHCRGGLSLRDYPIGPPSLR